MINDISIQKKIERRNRDIENAVLMSQMMEHDGFKIFIKQIKEIEKKFRFQDVMGIKDDALSDQKGIVLGVMEVINLIDYIKRLAIKPRKDPVTGEMEELKIKK